MAPDAARAPIVVARDVAKTYASGTHALAPVSLAIRPGEFVTLLGPSGCGKTTLLHLIAGLDAPTQGTLRWWGEGAPPHAGDAQRIGYVFQSPTLLPWARVRANVRLPLALANVERARADAAVDAALARVGLDAFARAFPRELSGGMRMRVSIARALVTRPHLLLLDEPFGALDEFSRHRLDDELAAWWRSEALTVVFVTHSIAEAVYLSTRILVMAARPGRIIADVPVGARYPRGNAFRASLAFAEQCVALSDLVAQASQADG
ncbi:MAG: ABC transporter ATP-binding protein [Betaproteobacteria bacterium]